MRRQIRKAKAKYPDLNWFGGVPEAPKVRRGLALYDLHYPTHHKGMWANFLKFVEDFQPDFFVFGGDNLDLEVISHWVGNKRRRIEGKRLVNDYKGFNTNILKPLMEVLPEDCEKVFLYGNHEDWVGQYIDEHPEVEGFLEIANNLNLDGWFTEDYGNTYQIGKLHFMHGEYINIHNAHKTVQVYGRNMVYGHGHTYQAHTMTAPLDAESHTAIQLPCACNLNPHYRLNKPNAWVNGFGTFYLYPSGNFNLFPVIAQKDGSFIAPTGIEYKKG